VTIAKKLLLLCLAVFIANICLVVFVSAQQAVSYSVDKPQAGDTMRFGRHYWRVLDVQDGKAFLLAESIIGRRAFSDELMPWELRTWRDSSIRHWLNSDFYMSFTYTERARIAETNLTHNNNPWWYGVNPDEPWRGTEMGNATVDKIFLLCIYDVLYYFGYCERPQLYHAPCGCCGRRLSLFGNVLNDDYNSYRMAMDNGRPFQWWLRTIGGEGGRLVVLGNGSVSSYGQRTDFRSGVRPAMWVYLEI